MVRSGSRGLLKWAPVRQEPSNPLRDGGVPSLKDAPSPRHTLHLSPSPKEGLRLRQPLKVAGKRGPQLTPPPLQWPNRLPQREMLARKHLWTSLRCVLGKEPPLLSSGGTLVLLMTKALTCPKVRAGRWITSPSSTTSSEGTTLTYPQPSSGRSSNQSSDTWGLARSSGPDSRRRTPCG